MHVGSSANHVLNTSLTSLTQSGLPESVANGQTFTIDDGSKVVTFQFVKTGGAAGGNVAISVPASKTQAQIADAIAAAIAGAGLGLSPNRTSAMATSMSAAS